MDRLSEWGGPVLVKELRQALRARAFLVWVAVLVLACAWVALFGAAKSHEDFIGPRVLRYDLLGLEALWFGVLPLGAFRSMQTEREGEAWALLQMTGLSARALVWGKWASAVCQGALYSSVMAPYVLFTWYLGGLDLPTILTGLAVIHAVGFLLVAWGAALGTQSGPLVGRMTLQLVMVGVSVLALALGVARTKVETLVVGSVELTHTLVAVAVSLGVGWLLLEGAIADLAVAAEGAVWLARRAVIIVVGLTWVGAGLRVSMGWVDPAELAWASGWQGLGVVVAGSLALAERDGWPRVLGDRGWKRPGALRTFTTWVGLLAGAGAFWWTLLWLQPSVASRLLAFVVATWAYGVWVLSVGVIGGRLTPLRRVGDGAGTRLATLGAVGSAAVLAEVAERLTSARWSPFHGAWTLRQAHVLSPVSGLADFLAGEFRQGEQWMVVVVGVLSAWAAYRVLARRDRERA